MLKVILWMAGAELFKQQWSVCLVASKRKNKVDPYLMGIVGCKVGMSIFLNGHIPNYDL